VRGGSFIFFGEEFGDIFFLKSGESGFGKNGEM
jgi:hypothetical protein